MNTHEDLKEIEIDFYNSRALEELLDEGSITPSEFGFMIGYL